MEKVHDITFSTLKESLCSIPVLAFTVLDGQFVLQTDASDVGLGAVLTQTDGNGMKGQFLMLAELFLVVRKTIRLLRRSCLSLFL